MKFMWWHTIFIIFLASITGFFITFRHRIPIVQCLIRQLIELEYDLFGTSETAQNARLNPSLYYPKQLSNEYDFIVVGAGTAGCAVANRLSENPEWNILLLEAGSEENLIMDVPMFVHHLQLTDTLNWKYKSEPAAASSDDGHSDSNNDDTAGAGKYCLAMENKQCVWPRGKVMGGSSVLNYMIYTRGNRADFDRWAELGNYGWSFSDVLPYFKKLENSSFEIKSKNDGGNDSPVTISKVAYQSEFSKTFINGAVELGIPNIQNYNSEQQIGVSVLQTTTKNGFRISSNRAYIEPIRGIRPNLFVKTKSHVSRIIFDKKQPINARTNGPLINHRAIGVEFYDNHGQLNRIMVKKEVIISAGAINSPQLLMLSGIGPKEHLQAKHIQPIIADLPGVGANLMDHITPGYFHFITNTTWSPKSELDNKHKSWTMYFENGTGPLGLPGACESLAFFDIMNSTNKFGLPDMEFLQISGGNHDSDEVKSNMGFTSKDYDLLYGSLEPGKSKVMAIGLFTLRPRSRGRILLKNNQSNSHPLIYPNYFSDPYDMEQTIRGIRKLHQLEHTEAFKRINATILRTTVEECKQFPYDSDDYWKCHAQHVTITIYHYSGTCKMGDASTDPMAVVDQRLRVLGGVQGVRVVDASIMPEIVSGHPNAAIFMIGEKAADMIKEDWAHTII